MPVQVYVMPSAPRERTVSAQAFAIALLAAFLLLVPASLARASGPNATVRGVITDAVSHGAVAGADIHLTVDTWSWDFEAITDAGGAYVLTVPNAQYAVRVTHPAYDVNTTNLNVGSGLTVWNNMSLVPVGTRNAHLRGYAKDSVSSAPITTGRVTVTTAWYVTGNAYENSSAMNATGYYAMDLVPNTYTARTEGILGYTPYTTSYLYLAAGATVWLNMSLTPDPLVAWVNGTVRDATNASPLVGARITATAGGMRLPDTTTNATGHYSLRVPADTVRLSADAVGYGPLTTSVYVYSPGAYVADVTLVRLGAFVRGFVRDGYTGAGLLGVHVVASPFWSTGYYDEVVSDASGAYRLNLTADDFDLSASRSGYTSWASYAFLTTGGTDWVNVTLWPLTATVQGYLVDGTTLAHVPNVYVTATDLRSGYTVYDLADASGFFSVVVPPSPAVMLRVTGTPPYVGAAVYLVSRASAVTWANITLDRVSATLRVHVTDASTGLPIAAAGVVASWVTGYANGVTDAGGIAAIGVAAGQRLSLSAFEVGYFAWSGFHVAVSGTADVTIELNPSLTANVTVKGYVRDAATNLTITSANVEASGYAGSSPWGYTDGSGFYTLNLVPYPQKLRATEYGYAAGVALVNPAPGATIWVNFSLPLDATTPRITSFTATPATGISPANPSALVAQVNETSFELASLSILMLHTTAGSAGDFLSLGTLDASTVGLAQPSPGNTTVSTAWDTRTPVAHLSDGTATEWWPATPAGYPFLVAIPGGWSNATLPSAVSGTAYFDSRSGALLYVYTTYGFITAADQPGSTFYPYGYGLRLDLTTAAISGTAYVTGATYRLGTLHLTVAQTVPGGTYAALIETYDAAYNYARAAVLLQVTADNVAPSVAITSPSGTASVSGNVTLTASATDNVGVVRVEFRVDGVYLGSVTTAPYSLVLDTRTLSDGPHTIEAVAYDAAGNAGTSTRVITVANAGTPAAPLGTDLGLWIFLGVVAAAVGAGIAFFFLWRRRPRAPAMAPPGEPPASPGPPPG